MELGVQSMESEEVLEDFTMKTAEKRRRRCSRDAFDLKDSICASNFDVFAIWI